MIRVYNSLKNLNDFTMVMMRIERVAGSKQRHCPVGLRATWMMAAPI